MIIDWIVGWGWNCRAEWEEEAKDYERIMAEREIAIKYFIESKGDKS